MNHGFETLKPERLHENPFQIIGQEWMLVTAGTLEAFNTMTASWGGMGVLWNRPVTFAFVRPQRYTFQFMNRADTFTLSFFDKRYREALSFCGAQSGRYTDKMAATGLTPQAIAPDTVTFAQARLVFVCRKLYAQDLEGSAFTAPEINAEIYPSQDYHRLFIGEVLTVLVARQMTGTI
ncbi:MAG: flavin reductase [Anaerolineae bacterium]|nr:flavin reductase [Anaerolineae bacterium]